MHSIGVVCYVLAACSILGAGYFWVRSDGEELDLLREVGLWRTLATLPLRVLRQIRYPLLLLTLAAILATAGGALTGAPIITRG